MRPVHRTVRQLLPGIRAQSSLPHECASRSCSHDWPSYSHALWIPPCPSGHREGYAPFAAEGGAAVRGQEIVDDEDISPAPMVRDRVVTNDGSHVV